MTEWWTVQLVNWTVQSMEEDKECGVQFESGPVQLCMFNTRRKTRRNTTGEIQFESVQEDRRKRGKGNLSWNASRAGKRRILQSTSWVQILTILLWNYSRYLRYLQYFKILQSTSDTYDTSSLSYPYNTWETLGVRRTSKMSADWSCRNLFWIKMR